MTSKSALRKQALTKRNALTIGEFEELNKKLLEQFKTLNFSNIGSLHIFLPIITKKEPDTFLIIDWLQEHHPKIQIIVPKADFEKSIMSHYVYLNREDLLKNHYHIPEPQKAKKFEKTPDVVILPLLAFDNKGFRVGYGKGFYDRFLNGLNTIKIGLSLFNVSEEINDVHLNDIRLDKCITPDRIIDFSEEN